MDTQETHEINEPLKQSRKKRGIILLLVAVVCFAIFFVVPAPELARTEQDAITRGVIQSIFSCSSVIFLLAGIVYLVLGFAGKTKQ